MRGFVLSGALVFAAACGGNHSGQSVCDNVVPAPPACMQACDAQPGAPNTCPGGYHCTPDGHCDALCTQGGTECGDGFFCTADGQCQGNDDCDGLECNIVQCQSMGMPATTISGKVFAPNGTLPLYGVQVYVPLHAVGDLPDGSVCSKCADTPLGDPIASDFSKEDGSFTLTNVPSGVPVPLVIVSGKWRRIVMVPTVNQCTDNAIGAADTTLPKSMTDMTVQKMTINERHVQIVDANTFVNTMIATMEATPKGAKPMAAVAAAKWVVTNALLASGPADRALPALKPNQPTHSIAAPMNDSTTECGAIGMRP